MTRLSVNINKIALIRNAREGNTPDVLKAAKYCEKHGADGITVHPRPDERHIRYEDVRQLAKELYTEFNIEGYPSEPWQRLIRNTHPDQITLVPDHPDQLTSDHGWDTIEDADYLTSVIDELKEYGDRVSLFVDPIPSFVKGAAEVGADRVELYTGPYAEHFPKNKEKAIENYIAAAQQAHKLGLGVNAGHDLNLNNLPYLYNHLPHLLEVSIGHALVSDALYYGLADTIAAYQAKLDNA